MRIYGYPPVVSPGCRILITGSMPSEESLKQGFYYAHPRNAFWRILADCFRERVPETTDEKKRLLLSNGVALWDVCASCERKGSLDSEIRSDAKNDFERFFALWPGINAVLANGGYAYSAFPRAALAGRPLVKLPSTSPAYTLKYEKKLILWQDTISQYLKGLNL